AFRPTGRCAQRRRDEHDTRDRTARRLSAGRVVLAQTFSRRRGPPMNGDTDVRLSSSFRLLDQSASTVAERTDQLFTVMLALCGAVALGVCLTIVVFSIRYRQGSRAARGNVTSQRPWLELAWTLLPLFLFLSIF